MFSSDPLSSETFIAPGPAAYSNGNGPEHTPEVDDETFGEVTPNDALVWVSEAPPLAIFIIAASGATFALLFIAIARAIRGNSN